MISQTIRQNEKVWLLGAALLIISSATILEILLGRGLWFSPLLTPLSTPGLSVSFSVLWFMCALKGSLPLRLASWGVLFLTGTLWLLNSCFGVIQVIEDNPFSVAYLASVSAAFFCFAFGEKHNDFSINLLRTLVLLFALAATSSFLFHSAIIGDVYDRHIIAIEQSLSIDTYALAGFFEKAVSSPALKYAVHLIYMLVTLEFLLLLSVEKAADRARIFWMFLAQICGGYWLYFYVPAIGPTAFHVASSVIDPVQTAHPLLVQTGDFPRNAFPSLHTAFGLLLILRAQKFSWPWRIMFSLLGCVNIFATVYLGEHWLLDLIPSSSLLILMLCLFGIVPASTKRTGLSVLCFVILISWLLGLRWNVDFLLNNPHGTALWVGLSLLGPWLGLWWANADSSKTVHPHALS